MRAPWLVRTSSLYFRKARALRHTSALSRYNARSLRHQYERAQFIIHSIACSSHIVELYKHLGFFKNTRESEKHSPAAHASLALLSCSGLKNPACLYNSTMHSARFLFLYNYSSILIFLLF